MTFAPAARVTGTATLSFDDDATTGPQNVFLSGTGIQPAVSMTTPAPFPNTNVCSTSTSQTVTITNGGTAPLNITVSRTAGQCGRLPPVRPLVRHHSRLHPDPGSSCQETVAFAPTTSGSRKALLQVSDDAPGSPARRGPDWVGRSRGADVATAPTIGTATPETQPPP